MGALFSKAATRLPRPARKRIAPAVLLRHQQGGEDTDPDGSRRTHVQSPYHFAVRSGNRASRGQARGQGPPRSVARTISEGPRHRSSRRPRRLPSGRALVRLWRRRGLSELHDWQCARRAVLCRALRAHPDIPQDMRAGEFVTLHGWLSDNLYRHGRKFTPAEVVQRATGEPITIKHYANYLH